MGTGRHTKQVCPECKGSGEVFVKKHAPPGFTVNLTVDITMKGEGEAEITLSDYRITPVGGCIITDYTLGQTLVSVCDVLLERVKILNRNLVDALLSGRG